MGWRDKPRSSASEQVRRTVPEPDYTVSHRATNPALVIHPAPCTDLLTNGQMPMTHLPVAFQHGSLSASGVACFNMPKKKKKGHSATARLTMSSCRAF